MYVWHNRFQARSLQLLPALVYVCIYVYICMACMFGTTSSKHEACSFCQPLFMYVCMYICVCIYVNVYVCMYVYLCKYACGMHDIFVQLLPDPVHVCMYVYVGMACTLGYVCMHAACMIYLCSFCQPLFSYVYMYMYMYDVYVCMFVFLFMCVCMRHT